MNRFRTNPQTPSFKYGFTYRNTLLWLAGKACGFRWSQLRIVEALNFSSTFSGLGPVCDNTFFGPFGSLSLYNLQRETRLQRRISSGSWK